MMQLQAAIVVLLLLLAFEDAHAEIYRWLDRHGQVHFTDDYASIPPQYRDRVRVQPSSPSAESPVPPGSGRKSQKAKSTKRSAPPSSAPARQAKVVAVLDGDTIIISGGEKVRYAGLNSPESHHPDKLPEYCGQEAFEANRRLVVGKTVRLEFDERRRDKYGRLLAYVYVDGLMVNAELIRQGYAQVSTYKDNQRYHAEFERLQRSAIAMRRGLWGGCVDIRLPPVPSNPKVERRRR
jgi:micrococcal nuclease